MMEWGWRSRYELLSDLANGRFSLGRVSVNANLGILRQTLLGIEFSTVTAIFTLWDNIEAHKLNLPRLDSAKLNFNGCPCQTNVPSHWEPLLLAGHEVQVINQVLATLSIDSHANTLSNGRYRPLPPPWDETTRAKNETFSSGLRPRPDQGTPVRALIYKACNET